MKYEIKLLIRIFLALIIAILNINLFYFLFSKLTFYLTYLSLSFYNVILKGNSFVINNMTLEFVPACTAASAYLLLTLLILLTKDISFKKGIKIFLVGSLLILIANMIRLDILAIILISYSKNLFNTLHMFFWKIVSSVYVALVWIFLVYIFDIKEIPVYSDIKKLKKLIKRKR